MAPKPAREQDPGEVFLRERPHLWGLCYRMTGDATEADDLVQETFERAVRSGPVDRERPWRPWLTQVATRLAIDALRRRQHDAYTGPWLPAPVRTAALAGLEPVADGDVQTRYEVLESATFAFLAALERLDPRQRAVLILAEVVGHGGPEIAEMLELSEANVRQILSRARAALRDYHEAPCRPAPALIAATRRALEGFFAALAAGDGEAMTRWLTEDVTCLTDAGGEFRAASKVVHGAADVVAFNLGVARHSPPPAGFAFDDVNGLPAILVTLPDDVGDERSARRFLGRVELGPDGERIAAIQFVLASRKLWAMEFPR